jgi:hypothetical protein
LFVLEKNKTTFWRKKKSLLEGGWDLNHFGVFFGEFSWISKEPET